MRRITSRRSARRDPAKGHPSSSSAGARIREQRTAAPSQQAAPQHERREVDRSERRQHTPPSGQPAQGHVRSRSPKHSNSRSTPVQTPQTREAQPGRNYGDRPAARTAGVTARAHVRRPAGGATRAAPSVTLRRARRSPTRTVADWRPVPGFSFPYLYHTRQATSSIAIQEGMCGRSA